MAMLDWEILRGPAQSLIEDYLGGAVDCWEAHPTLGTEPENILIDGMYLVMLPVGAVRPNTWKRQFSTSAT